MYSSNFKVTMIVAAAGVGKRMGLDYPKQFFEYKGKPLFIMPLEVAQNSKIVDEIVVVTNKENVSLVENYCNQYGLSKIVKVIEGGKERQNSIYNALKYDNNSDIILVQDGVRPFLKEKYIEECCRVVAEERLGAVVGVQVKDTIKVINESFEVVSTPKRADLVAVHTPQAFEGKLLKKAYEIAESSSLVERIGGKVKIVLGDYDNIKITTQEDLKFL